MPQTLDEQTDGDRFSSLHIVATPLPEARLLVVRSGMTRVDFGGAPAGSDWTRDVVSLRLSLQPAIDRLAEGKAGKGKTWAVEVEQWAAQAALGAFTNPGQAVNPGWAVDGFRLVAPEGGATQVQLDVDLAVDDDSITYRVSFWITLVGTLVQAASQA